MNRQNLRVLASRLADHVSDFFEGDDRGLLDLQTLGHLVAFATDGYEQDPRSRRAVEILREDLMCLGFPVLGFGISSDGGYSWAMIIDADLDNFEAYRPLYDVIQSSWAEANAEFEANDPELEEKQRRLALEAIEEIEDRF